MDEGNRASIEDKVRRLEREVFELRRALQPSIEALPAQPFDALEVEVDEHSYLIAVSAIREVRPALLPTPLPEAPPWVRGTFRYGKSVVPLIDLRLRLHGVKRPLSVTDVIVLLEEAGWTGLLADEARDVVRVDPSDLVPPAPGIPQAPLLVASLSRGDAPIAHLLSTARIRRDFLADDER